MSAVVEALGDAVEGIVEGVGDVFESVGEAVEDVGDWIGENVIEPIKEDPLTFIVSAAAYAYGIPGLGFAGAGTAASVGIATTASNLVQGKDFDDSIKAGITSFATTGLGNAASNAIGGQNIINADDWYSSPPSGAASSVGGDLFGASQPKPGSSSGLGLDDFDMYSNNSTAPKTGLDGNFADNAFAQSSDDMLRQMGELTPDQLNAAKMADASAAQPKANTNPVTDGGGYKPANASLDASKNVAQNAARDAVTPDQIYDIGGNIKYDVPEVMPVQDVGVSYGLDDYTGKVPVEERSSTFMKGVDVETPLLQGATNLADAVGEQAGSWVWDGMKWAWKNPELALGGAYLASTLLEGKDGPPSPGGDKPEAQKERDSAFNASLPLYDLSRSPTASPFGGRDQNIYESGLSDYAQKGGEHNFYTPTTYNPVTYDANQMVQAAQGGPIGALNNQLPSYYRYGEVPATMNMAQGGYAQGGLNSVREDGRSDHIPAMLSDGEYVIDAETVALLGNGSNKAGANRLESMRQDIRKQKGGALAKGKFSPNARSPLSYMKARG